MRTFLCQLPISSWTSPHLVKGAVLLRLGIQWKVTLTLDGSQEASVVLTHGLPGASPSVTIVYSTHHGWTSKEALAEGRNQEEKTLTLRVNIEAKINTNENVH